MRRPTSPGEILKKEFMEPLGITISQLSELSRIKSSTISRLINNKTTVTPLTALKLGRLFKTTPAFWLNLQQAVDIHDTMVIKEVSNDVNLVMPFQGQA